MSIGFQFDKDWQLHPLEGDTGQAFMGTRSTDKVFIKRNTSPFLAALSKEGITPKLVWTRRTGSGDTITAQEWLDGNVLTSNEVGNRLDVVRILRHVHSSESLKKMLFRVGGEQVSAFDLLCQYAENLPVELKHNLYLTRVFRFLEDHLPEYSTNEYCVCHGDVNHKNWLLSTEDRLYLVDWDSVMFGDPAIDVGTILGRYVPLKEWNTWLKAYGLKPTEDIMARIHWYSIMTQMLQIRRQYHKSYFKNMNQEILLLKKIFAY